MTLKAAVIQWRRDRNKTKGKTPRARLEVLQKWARVVVEGDTRNVAERRRAFKKGFTKARVWKTGMCWVCRCQRLLIRHHVIQLQNGGNSWHLNVERICADCHGLIHPWLTSQPEHVAENIDVKVPF